MAWSRVDRDELLVVAKTREQVAAEVETFKDRFVQRHPVMQSLVVEDFYCWMDRRKQEGAEVSDPQGGGRNGRS